MSDEEEYEDEEVEEEEEVEEPEESVAEEAPASPKKEAAPEKVEEQETPKEEAPKLRPPPPREEEKAPEEMTEAEAAIMAARKRKEEEDAHKLLDYEQQRVIEKKQIEDELRELREKQQRRRAERDQEDREYQERLKKAEELRRQEEEAHKQQIEAEKQRREQEKQKRQQMIAGSLLGAAGGGGGANYVVQKGSGGAPGAAGEGEGGKKKRGPTAEQIAAAKQQYIAMVSRKPDLANILPNDLKTAIKRLHTRIERIVGEMYDLQQRASRQEYDLKELHDRELQAQRNKALKMGVDPSETGDLKHPPKVHVASKFDRQTDRRTYVDKRVLFEKPYVKPDPKIAHGTARPPPEWGRKKGTGVMDEIETIRKQLEPPKYVEQAPIEGAKPPVSAIPLQIPDDDEPEPAQQQEVEAEA